MNVGSILDNYDEDEIISQIANGISQSQIARDLEVSNSLLSFWLQKEDGRNRKAQAARKQSAESYIDKAEAVLLDTTVEIARAKELANHYRHVAKIRNPAEYGDKIDVSGRVEHQHSLANLLQELGPVQLIGSDVIEDATLIE